MKKLLIISPHFPPVNAADMHRVRQSLPYFSELGWEPTVICVYPEFVVMSKDIHLEKTIPNYIEIHKVTAFSTSIARKIGLGNIGLRAFWQIYKKGNELLGKKKYDLIYFSTTVFATMPLGRLWKQKFGTPFVIDLQDPWRNDYYLKVPKKEKPPKFWFAYRLNKYMEAFTIPKVDGIITVSKGYIETLQARYPSLNVPTKVITFGAATNDFEMADKLYSKSFFQYSESKINVVYMGVVNQGMRPSISLLFSTFKMGLSQNVKFEKFKFWFIGTSYAPDGEGVEIVKPLAKTFGIGEYVEEITDRKPYFQALSILQQSDIILIPGSNDKDYTASKLYPNILAKRPILCIFHSNSSVGPVVEELKAGEVVFFDKENPEEKCFEALNRILEKLPYVPNVVWEKFLPYTAKARTEQQVQFFNLITFV